MSKKYVYFFGVGMSEGNATMRNLLGGKGANLAEMTNIGIPVPPGFTISTEACVEYYDEGKQFPQGLHEEIDANLSKLEDFLGKKLGDLENPLLVSVRSGARISMPGMMDTILNLGLNEESTRGLANKSGNERFAYDCYRRFIQMFGNVVLEMEHHDFEEILRQIKDEKGVKLDTDLDIEALKEVVRRYKEKVKEATGSDFPEDPKRQLVMACEAVFKSWNNTRAIKYRELNGIPHSYGTAVNVQTMVFGNMGDSSGTGVAFTRNPSTGERKFYGEYLTNAQGEDVVAGIRTPQEIATLQDVMPQVYTQLVEIYQKLEKHYKDMQDLEFTVEDGKLYLLQTRTGKRTGAAAVRIAVEMFNEGLIDKQTAVMRIEPKQLDQLLHPMIDPNASFNVVAKGLPASPGAASGEVVFTADRAEKLVEQGHKVILVRTETSPEDIGGMNVARGILTSTGGMTSHAAVVARGMGKCCVAGCSDVVVKEKAQELHVAGQILREGDILTLNGSTGEVIIGEVPLVEPAMSGDFKTLMEWADEMRALKVRTNADTPKDSKIARNFGAEGIGLCRTEHMFFEGNRIESVREMILADDKTGRRAALAKLLPMQKEDFIGIFRAMESLPVTIRLLDPPLHEFLPHEDKDIEQMAQIMGVDAQKIKDKVLFLKEFNPMLGHRGCRLGITYPEIYEMQVQAIIEAACVVNKEGVKVLPEIMIPLVGHVRELQPLTAMVHAVAEKVFAEYNDKVEYMVGTMIEVPRAALTADEIASNAQFFSFGTNDLTQMTFGFSRDDAGKFLPEYIKRGVLENDPFQTLDQVGVGNLIKIAVEKGRSVKSSLKIGICGEHGGDPASVEFCHNTGFDYVSCSPFRVPIARLAAAQANIKNKRMKNSPEMACCT